MATHREAGALSPTGALHWVEAQAWLEAARGQTQRELEALVADKSPGDAPDAPGAGSPRRRVLRFEVAADTFATFREAMQRLERAAGARLDHDALLLAMARHVLGGPADDGRSSYQISLHVCSVCNRGAQVAGGDLVPVDATVVKMAECDAQHLGRVLAPVVEQRAASENADSPHHGSPRPPGTAQRDVQPDTGGRCLSHAHMGAATSDAENACASAALTRGSSDGRRWPVGGIAALNGELSRGG